MKKGFRNRESLLQMPVKTLHCPPGLFSPFTLLTSPFIFLTSSKPGRLDILRRPGAFAGLYTFESKIIHSWFSDKAVHRPGHGN